MLPGGAIAGAGVAMLALAQGQPAWLGGQFGPGLMARLLGIGVIGLGAAWMAICAISPHPPRTPAPSGTGLAWSGPALLGAVLVFALALPALGLVLAAGLAAMLAALGAGERRPRGLAVTVAGLMALVAGIGELLLPPTAPLWPGD
jgi:hypothetical protein